MKKKKTYFVAILKETNDICIATTKSSIASFLGISYKTVYRQFINNEWYENKSYIIYKGVSITKIKRHK